MQPESSNQGNDIDIVPASMLNEFSYCPRRCYFEWIEGEFVECEATLEGRSLHRRLELEPENLSEMGLLPVHAREISLFGPQVGIACRIDLLVGDGKSAIPVEYKRGAAPDIPEGAYEPDKIQVCAQALVLRENGFQCQEGRIFFAKDRRIVEVFFDDALVQRTLEVLKEVRMMALEGKIPQPLRDSPKCNHCSMAGICLPDEVNLLKEGERTDLSPTEVRMLFASEDERVPVYVVGQGSMIRKRGDRLEIWSRDGRTSDPRLIEISQVNLYGGVEITTPATVELMQRGVPVLHFTHGGWFEGICSGNTNKNVLLRARQFECAKDAEKSLAIARSIVSVKIKNCRTLIKRNDPQAPEPVLDSLKQLGERADEAEDMAQLLGIEGIAAEKYFSRFDAMLKSKASEFSFQNRNKRPPRDPINSVLSYLYGILAKELFVTVLAVGFDPYLGFYHQPRNGRPALALDMMEEFRPLIADSSAITMFNKGELSGGDFLKTGIGVTIKPEAKKKVVAAYERRIETEVSHPLFGYSVSYRRVLELQARLLSRHLMGEIGSYPAFLTR